MGKAGNEALANSLNDVILLDLLLPDMSGFEVCCRLKAHAATAAIPVLHLSDTPAEDCEAAKHLETGDELYLTHPVDATDLLASVGTLLRVRRTQRQFELFLEAAPDAVVIVDADGKIVRVNGQAEAMFGYGRDQYLSDAPGDRAGRTWNMPEVRHGPGAEDRPARRRGRRL